MVCRVGLLAQVFKSAFTRISPLLSTVHGSVNGSVNGSGEGVIAQLFSTVIQRYNNAWRPDAISNNVSLTTQDLSRMNLDFKIPTISHDNMLRNIDYCNFVVESIISESSILTFCVDILTWKGPLPTGLFLQASFALFSFSYQFCL